MTFIFRKITDDDLDLLFASPDVKEALYGIFFDRQHAEDRVENGGSMTVVKQTGEMIFSLGGFSGLEGESPRYAYLFEGRICTIIETAEGYELSIYYCSSILREGLPHIKEVMTQALIYGGETLTGNNLKGLPEEIKRIAMSRTYTFIESKQRHFR
ncbi:hypothetical protein [Psychrobacter fozii]|uniref:Uncharacterized protein n=1 Tax=Psychrobacter fozii TaxID=198480 RepID=A0A2V4URT8_9GAMM|nr:hypothetical protein [Psychrobacter fozii]PYE39216.1 hypothetical protein DFP82_10428 [Psychrobacter fozii]